MKPVAAVNQTCGRGDANKFQLFGKLMHDSVDVGNVFLNFLFVEISELPEKEGTPFRFRSRRKFAMTVRKSSFIAKRLGFNDEFYFSRFFRHNSGLLPTEFRKIQ